MGKKKEDPISVDFNVATCSGEYRSCIGYVPIIAYNCEGCEDEEKLDSQMKELNRTKQKMHAIETFFKTEDIHAAYNLKNWVDEQLNTASIIDATIADGNTIVDITENSSWLSSPEDRETTIKLLNMSFLLVDGKKKNWKLVFSDVNEPPVGKLRVRLVKES